MKRLLTIISFLAVFLPLNAQSLKVDTSNQKELKTLSAVEINAIFDKANTDFKVLALQKMADDKFKTLNGSLLIALDNKVIVRKTSGYARLFKKGKDLSGMTQAQLSQARDSLKNKLLNETPFELASVSKQFTAVAILKLASQGKLSLHDYLGKYYPSSPYLGITIHNLLSHTSGLPEYFDFPAKYWDSVEYVDNKMAIDTLFGRNEKIMFKPGMDYTYVNTNYIILADIVSKVSGMPFEQYMADSIFSPLGMCNTFYFTEKKEHPDIVFPRGHLASGEEVAFEPLDGTIGDKGLYSCAEDLLKWKIALFDEHAVIPQEWLEKATVPENNLINGAKPSELYGYGYHIEVTEAHGKLIYHGGLWHGFNHIMAYRPSDNLFFICLSNYRNRVHVGKCDAILSILDGI